MELARGDMEIRFYKGWRSRGGVGWGGVIRSYDGSGKSERKGVCGKLSAGRWGYHRGVAGRSVLGVWGGEGRFRWKIEGCEPEYQDQQKRT